MTTRLRERTDRRAGAEPGQAVSGRLLEEFCRNASADRRDWFRRDDRRQATGAFAAALRRAGAAGSRQGVPAKLILVEGPRGCGKSAVVNYFAAQFALAGAETYHSGCFGYGRALEEAEWYTAINNVRQRSVVFIDETASVNRQGRDQADIQGIMNEQFTALRKQECLVFCASAMSHRVGRVLREMADEIWRPQKVRVEFSERERRRRGRRPPRARDDPANYAYCVYRVTDQPYRAPGLFDDLLGEARDRHYRPPRYRKALDPYWMRLVMPLLDTFRPVPIGAALAVSRQAVINAATGRRTPQENRDQRFWDTVSHLAAAFNAGRLPPPPAPAPELAYQPSYKRVSEIRNATESGLTERQFAESLREDLRLTPHPDRGYEMLELFEAVEGAVGLWQQEQEALP